VTHVPVPKCGKYYLVLAPPAHRCSCSAGHRCCHAHPHPCPRTPSSRWAAQCAITVVTHWQLWACGRDDTTCATVHVVPSHPHSCSHPHPCPHPVPSLSLSITYTPAPSVRNRQHNVCKWTAQCACLHASCCLAPSPSSTQLRAHGRDSKTCAVSPHLGSHPLPPSLPRPSGHAEGTARHTQPHVLRHLSLVCALALSLSLTHSQALSIQMPPFSPCPHPHPPSPSSTHQVQGRDDATHATFERQHNARDCTHHVVVRVVPARLHSRPRSSTHWARRRDDATHANLRGLHCLTLILILALTLACALALTHPPSSKSGTNDNMTHAIACTMSSFMSSLPEPAPSSLVYPWVNPWRVAYLFTRNNTHDE